MEKTYYLTIYKSDGENVLNESFNAKNDEEAKEIGMKMLKENNSLEQTHRLVSPDGRLLLFHS